MKHLKPTTKKLPSLAAQSQCYDKCMSIKTLFMDPGAAGSKCCDKCGDC